MLGEADPGNQSRHGCPAHPVGGTAPSACPAGFRLYFAPAYGKIKRNRRWGLGKPAFGGGAPEYGIARGRKEKGKCTAY